ncbi:MAG: hypothetical protein ACKO3W_01285, partial [bacterium]
MSSLHRPAHVAEIAHPRTNALAAAGARCTRRARLAGFFALCAIVIGLVSAPVEAAAHASAHIEGAVSPAPANRAATGAGTMGADEARGAAAASDGSEIREVAETAGDSSSGTPEQNQATARNAVYGFITHARAGEWDEAAGYLAQPMDGWPEGADPVLLARALKLILDERLWIDFDEIPDLHKAVDGDDEGTQPDDVRIGEIQVGDELMAVDVVEKDGRWSFAPETVTKIPHFSRALGSWWI